MNPSTSDKFPHSGDAVSAGDRPWPRFGWPEVALYAIGICLLLLRLGDAPLSNDEALTVRKVAFDWRHLYESLRGDNYPVGSFVYLKLWTSVFGHGEWAIRLASIPFAVLTWGLFDLWLRGFLDDRRRRLALAIVILSPFFLFAGRLLKYYTLLNAAFMGMTLFAWRIVQRSQYGIRVFRRDVVFFSIAALAAVYTHYLGVVMWASLILWLLLHARRTGSPEAWRLLKLLFLLSFLYIPQVALLVQRLVIDTGSSPIGIPETGLRRFLVQFGYMGYSFALGHTLEVSRVIPAAAGAIAFWILCGAGILKARRFVLPGAPGTPAEMAAGFALFTVIPNFVLGYLLMWIFLGHALPDMDYGERLCYLFPLAVLFLVVGLQRFSAVPRFILLTAFALPALYSTANIYTFRENNRWEFLIPWKEIRGLLVERLDENPALLIDHWSLGSRPWYYTRDLDIDDYAIHRLYDAGVVEETVSSIMARNQPVFLFRETRDQSPERITTRIEEQLTSHYGPPCIEHVSVYDSPSMLRLKQFLRRGTTVETYQGKIRILYFCPDATATDSQGEGQ